MKHTLTPADIGELARLEAIIEKEQGGFLRVGGALMAIREQRLYLRDYETFEAYCQERWKFSARRALQLIDSTVAVEALPTEIGTMVPTERAAREIAKVEPAKRVEAVEAVVKSGKPVTAKAIKEAAKPAELKPVIVMDEVGRPIPPDLLPLWERRAEIREHLTTCSRLKGVVQKAMDEADPLWAEVVKQQVIADLGTVRFAIKNAMPFAVCPVCHGKVRKNCRACHARGFVSELYWKQHVPEELK